MPKKAKNNKTKAVSRSKTAKRTKKTIVKKATQKKKTTNIQYTTYTYLYPHKKRKDGSVLLDPRFLTGWVL